MYGWTLFLVIQTGTAAAVAVGFAKFLGVFFPTIGTTHWILHLGVGFRRLEHGKPGGALVIITLLTLLNTFGVKLGSLVQNVFTTAKILALAGVVGIGFVAKNAMAIAANFGAGWHQFWAGRGLGFVAHDRRGIVLAGDDGFDGSRRFGHGGCGGAGRVVVFGRTRGIT